jgi:hypothetical protein
MPSLLPDACMHVLEKQVLVSSRMHNPSAQLLGARGYKKWRWKTHVAQIAYSFLTPKLICHTVFVGNTPLSPQSLPPLCALGYL